MTEDEKTESMNDDLSSNEGEDDSLANSESSLSASSRSSSPESEPQRTDPRFVQRPASRFKRTFLILFLALLFWLALSMRSNVLDAKKKAKVVHASRYSKDYKFRPAASPIVTETLKDGRTRLRGALPEQTAPPPPPVVKKKRKTSTGKVSGKRKSTGSKHKSRPLNHRRM